MQLFDMITALTLGGILIILVLYVVVVYKKGWLKRNSKESETHFLCPNPNCRRVFKEPIWLTDLSKSPPVSFQSCPHCGENLEKSPTRTMKKSPELESTLEPARFLEDSEEPSESVLSIQKETAPKIEIARDLSDSSSLPISLPKNSEKSADLHVPKTSSKAPESRMETSTKLTETSKKHEVRKLSKSVRTCSHFFGYLRTLPKNTSFPDECLWCPQLVKCLTGTKKIRA